MPTIADLDRLQALVDRLAPLAEVDRGDRIRAEDWNTVVGSLVELSRAVLAEESDGSVPPHEHPDQVGATWLDPRLRTLLERGPVADPASTSRITELERRAGQLDDRAAGHADALDGLRDRLGEVVTRDLVRQADVTSVRRVVDGMADARDDVAELRTTLDTVRVDVELAVEVGKRLAVDGEPLDAQAAVDRIKALEGFRDRLTLPTGEPLDGTALEHLLTDLVNGLVTQQELDGTIAKVEEELAALERRVAVLENSAGQGDEALDAKLAEFRESITADFEGIATKLFSKLQEKFRPTLVKLITQIVDERLQK